MARFFRILMGLLAALIVLAIWAWNSRAAQDWMLETALDAALPRITALESYAGLKVFLCGTSSPLPDPNRAQACVAVQAGESLYLVDAGAGSARVATLGQLPLQQLEGVFLTHFHSDHIAALPEFNLNSWVAGRKEPLTVFGPAGVADVVDGFNTAYGLDFEYRVKHHGDVLLPPELGPMVARQMDGGTVLEFGDLAVTSFPVNHDPVRPAVGYRFDYRGRSVVISGDAILTPGLVDAATGADLLLQDALSVSIIQAFEKASAGTRMEHIFRDIQDYHAHTESFSELAKQSGVRQLAAYHLVPPPQNALLRKIFVRDLPEDTILTSDGMIFELPENSTEVIRFDP